MIRETVAMETPLASAMSTMVVFWVLDRFATNDSLFGLVLEKPGFEKPVSSLE
jgi:hypothetical protein